MQGAMCVLHCQGFVGQTAWTVHKDAHESPTHTALHGWRHPWVQDPPLF
jgi:hypothetical protein